jgi:L-threonylcarbamoyladenylate synthase
MRRALKILARGGVVVFPTETLYGLAALSINKQAVRKVYKIKHRPAEKLLPVIVGSMEQAEKYFLFNKKERALAQKFWPGPLSLVLKTRSKRIAAALGSTVLAVRYPANVTAAALAERSSAPITATSANISNQPGCFTIAAVKKQFAHNEKSARPDFFLDGGRLKKSLPSTIIRITRGVVVVIREGATAIKEIDNAIAI